MREMLQFVAQRMMELDVESRCGASYAERGVPRENSRNGYMRTSVAQTAIGDGAGA
jgi:putative transposase